MLFRSYYAMVDFYGADFGYVLDIDKLPEVTVENADVGTVVYNAPYNITFAVTAEHDWDEGKVTKEPTIGSEGIKAFTCKHNEEHTKKESIAKVDPAPLKEAIKAAQDAEKDVETSADGKDVAVNKQWTTAAEKKALDDTIAEAEKVAADTNSTQTEVEAAAAKLADAVEAFNKAKKAGKKEDPTPAPTPSPSPTPSPDKNIDRITPSDSAEIGRAHV